MMLWVEEHQVRPVAEVSLYSWHRVMHHKGPVQQRFVHQRAPKARRRARRSIPEVQTISNDDLQYQRCLRQQQKHIAVAEAQLKEHEAMEKMGLEKLREQTGATKQNFKNRKKLLDDAMEAYRKAEGDPGNPPEEKAQLELDTMAEQKRLTLVDDVETPKYRARKAYLTQHGGVGDVMSDAAGRGVLMGNKVPDEPVLRPKRKKDYSTPGPWAPDKKKDGKYRGAKLSDAEYAAAKDEV